MKKFTTIIGLTKQVANAAHITIMLIVLFTSSNALAACPENTPHYCCVEAGQHKGECVCSSESCHTGEL